MHIATTSHHSTAAALNCHLQQLASVAGRLATLRGAGRRQAMRDLVLACEGIF